MTDELPAVRIIRNHYISKGYVHGRINRDEVIIYIPDGLSDDDLSFLLADAAERLADGN